MPGSSAPGNPLTGDVDPGARRDASGTGTTHRGHNGSTPVALRGKHRENTGSTASSIAGRLSPGKTNLLQVLPPPPSPPGLRSLSSWSPVPFLPVSGPSQPSLRSLSPGSPVPLLPVSGLSPPGLQSLSSRSPVPLPRVT
ncbi:unnamed protein product [Arctogadus glacialis]